MMCRKNVKEKEFTRKCKRGAKYFFRVKYSAVRKHWDNGKQEDVIGFCPSCAPGMDQPRSYTMGWTAGTVARLRGDVGEVTPCAAADAKDDVPESKHADLKARIVAIMGQKNNQDIAPESWDELFADCVRDHVVKTVMSG